MDDSEGKTDSDGSLSRNGRSTPRNGAKPKRRSLVERELETSLTARVTSPVSSGETSRNTSRYGRTRRLKTDSEFCDSDKAIATLFKSPNSENIVKSPVYKMHASNTPTKQDCPKTMDTELETSNIENQIETIVTKNVSLSRFSTEEHKQSPAKKSSKVYVRKDLIQSKEKEETVTIMKNMFSPARSPYKPSTNTHLSNILERSSEKYNLNVDNKQNGYLDTSSVVKTLDFDTGKKKKKPEETNVNNTALENDLFDLEAKSEYQVGDLAWSRVGTYPFWPCIITRDPFSGLFVKKKLFGRVERNVLHVTFFGDNGRRGWIVDNMLRHYQGLQEFETVRDGFTPQSKKKDPRLYAAFFISDKKRQSWNVSVQEAETLMREPKRLRIDTLYDMIHRSRALKTTPKRQKSERIARTDSDVSLSESLYDTLFSEDDTKDEQDKSRNKQRKTSLDVSDVVTACLDNMAAKTGISKIQKQSHMDRWLQKAKSATPEKAQIIAGSSKNRNEGSGTKKSRKTPSKNQRASKKKRCGNEHDKRGLVISRAYQLTDHDYTKLDTENANPGNQDGNIMVVNDVNMTEACGIGIISKVETLCDNNFAIDEPIAACDTENNMSVLVEEVVTETDVGVITESCQQDLVSEASGSQLDAVEQKSDDKDTKTEIGVPESTECKDQEEMEVDTSVNIENGTHSEVITANESQTSDTIMQSNNEETPPITRRSNRLSLNRNTKGTPLKPNEVFTNGDVSYDKKEDQIEEVLVKNSSKKVAKSPRIKKKDKTKSCDNLSLNSEKMGGQLDLDVAKDHTNNINDTSKINGDVCHDKKQDQIEELLVKNSSKKVAKSPRIRKKYTTKNCEILPQNITKNKKAKGELNLDFSKKDSEVINDNIATVVPDELPKTINLDNYIDQQGSSVVSDDTKIVDDAKMKDFTKTSPAVTNINDLVSKTQEDDALKNGNAAADSVLLNGYNHDEIMEQDGDSIRVKSTPSEAKKRNVIEVYRDLNNINENKLDVCERQCLAVTDDKFLAVEDSNNAVFFSKIPPDNNSSESMLFNGDKKKNGDLNNGAEVLDENAIIFLERKVRNDARKTTQVLKEISEVLSSKEVRPVEKISKLKYHESEEKCKQTEELAISKNSEVTRDVNVKNGDENMSIDEQIETNIINSETKGSALSPDITRHPEPMEFDDTEVTKAPTLAEILASDDNINYDDEEESEPESPQYEDISLDKDLKKDQIISDVVKDKNATDISPEKSQKNEKITDEPLNKNICDKVTNENCQDESNKTSKVARSLSFNYKDELIPLKEFEVKITRMPMETYQNKFEEMIDKANEAIAEKKQPKTLQDNTKTDSKKPAMPKETNVKTESKKPDVPKEKTVKMESIKPVAVPKENNVKTETVPTDDSDDEISIAAMSRSYSEEAKLSKEAKAGPSSDKASTRPKRKPSKDKTTQGAMAIDAALENPEFLKYIELRQDALIDENPHVTEDEVLEYLFKTWLYTENLKSDTVKSHDKEESTLVKGLSDEPPPQPKKVRKKIKIEKEKEDVTQSADAKDRSKRKVARAYYNENDTDPEEELKVFEIFKMVNKEPEKANVEKTDQVNTKMKEDTETVQPQVETSVDEFEEFFLQLAKPKPNVFKGIARERVCEICDSPGNLVKCKGLCAGMFHTDCVKKQTEPTKVPNPVTRGRKKKKTRIRKPKSLDDSGSLSDDKTDLNLSEETATDEIQLENNLVIDAENFETQLELKMQEMLKTDPPEDYDYSSEDELQWNDTIAGKCEIVDVKLKLKPFESEIDFKCNQCLKNEIPACFVCKSTISPKNSVEQRQKCQTTHCHKYYHLECLEIWPQTQFSGGEPSKQSRKVSEGFEALTCPRHVCHTCVCDDPRGCNTRFSGDKLARCVRCPATYHSFNKCLPAGSTILSASYIICPRHYEHRPGKVPCHVNTGWCFICALGGTLICCEYCPTSFHAECLNIKPPEGNYMCEDCETGRLPLYGEMVWVKLGHYRWWPGIVLHPSEIPENVMAVKHSQGEFVVRFFGQYDHYWVNRGRVFPFLEGDSGRISSQKSKIDEAFTMAMEHAYRACEILKNAAPNEEEDTDIASSLLPPHYVKLKVNKPCGALVNYRPDDEENSITLCECDPNDVEPCGPDTHCLNRMLLTECGPSCRAGDRCCNRAFENRWYPKLTPYRTRWGGWGLKTLEPIRQGQFVIEYVGELLDEAEFRRRMQRKHETRDENYYFLTLDRDRMIDAGPKGNLARFMNHCCEPNCETQKWTVLGDVRVGLFALRDIPANSEVTFNYNLECAGIEKKPCLCGAKRCSGYIGAKPKQEEVQPKKGKLQTKRTYKKRKVVEISPSTSKTKTVRPRTTQRSKPKEQKELTEIEKDLLIIKNATNGLLSSDSESSGRLSSVDAAKEDVKPLKRKRVSFSTEEIQNGDVESPCVKKFKMDVVSEVGD